MTLEILQFCIGIVILLFSAELLVRFAIGLTLHYKISPLVIGTTIVAIGTSLPELAVSVLASFHGDSGLALGNIIGSNIVNTSLILPIGILIHNIRVGTTKTQRNNWLLVGVSLLICVFRLTSTPPVIAGVFLLVMAIIFTFTEYRWGRIGKMHEDYHEFKNHKARPLHFQTLVLLFISIAGIIMGGLFTVTSVESMALKTGISTTILGLTLTAIVTSLPELLTTVVSQEQNHQKLTLGNIIGSNVYNVLFVGGITLLFAPGYSIPIVHWALFFAASCLLFVVVTYHKGKTISRPAAVSLLSIFVLYIILLRYAS